MRGIRRRRRQGLHRPASQCALALGDSSASEFEEHVGLEVPASCSRLRRYSTTRRLTRNGLRTLDVDGLRRCWKNLKAVRKLQRNLLDLFVRLWTTSPTSLAGFDSENEPFPKASISSWSPRGYARLTSSVERVMGIEPTLAVGWGGGLAATPSPQNRTWSLHFIRLKQPENLPRRRQAGHITSIKDREFKG